MRSTMWKGVVLAAVLAVPAWAGKEDAATVAKPDPGKGVTAVKRSALPGGTVTPATGNTVVLKLSTKGLAGWQKGATRFGFNAREVVQAHEQQVIGGKPRSWWAERARASLTAKKLSLDLMNLPRAELVELLRKDVIDEDVFIEILYARGDKV